MKKYLLAGTLLLSFMTSSFAQCVTEQQAISGAAEEGLAEYRRGTDVTDPQGHYDLAIAFLDANGKGIGVFFRNGCVVDVGGADKAGVEEYFRKYSNFKEEKL